MPPKKRWPETRAERRDRDRVVELVHRVGEKKLRFTVADLRTEMGRNELLGLERSDDLARHVADLPPTLLREVNPRLCLGVERTSLPRTKHCFVLTHRLREYRAAGKDLDDLERIYLALWTAYRVNGDKPVPTSVVTRVTKEIEALAPDRVQQTNLRLKVLASRHQPLAEKQKRPPSRWLLWKPLGPAPLHRDFQSWVRRIRELAPPDGPVVSTGNATRGELVAELVEVAIRETVSGTWPNGRSVSMADIRAATGKDLRAKELARKLRASGSSLGVVLGELTKERIAGQHRVHQNVAKVPNPWGSTTYYDMPMRPGFDRRSVVVLFRGVQEAASARVLEGIQEEWSAASQLASMDSPLGSVGRIREFLVQRELDALGELVQRLLDRSDLISKANRNRVSATAKRLSAFRRYKGTTAAALSAAESAARALRVSLAEMLESPRPLLTATEYAAFFPERARDGRTPAEFLARVQSLRRFPNPDFTSRFHGGDPRQKAPTAVDRVDALVYAVQRRTAKAAPLLLAGYRLLGRNLRASCVPESLMNTGDPAVRRASLGALVLLGADAAAKWARLLIEDPDASTSLVIDALRALVVLDEFRRDELPSRIARAKDLALREVLRSMDLAQRQGRLLLQS